MAETSASPRRLFLPKFLSQDQCKELEFIHKSSSTLGYRPSVFSTTLSHLIATNCPQLIAPFVPIREKLKEKVEEFFHCEYELCVEFTGLISWTKGASIGWHSDDNRPYLKQRDFTDLLIYTADSRNIHSVDEVTGGERLTLTLWFSRNNTHDEDVKLISRLLEIYSSVGSNGSRSPLPAPASSNMYLFSRDQPSDQELAINICFARLLVLGFSIYSSHDENDLSEPCDLLLKPLQLIRGDELFGHEFSNILHALQVVHYYFWRASYFPSHESESRLGKVTKLSCHQMKRVNNLELVLGKDHGLAWDIFGFTSHEDIGLQDFNWAWFSAAVSGCEDYMSEKCNNLLLSLPHWRNHQSLFCVSFE